MRRALGLGLALAAALYALALAAILSQRHALIYPFDPAPVSPAEVGLADISVAAPPGGPPVWLAPPRGGSPVIVFFMGNAGSLRHFAGRLAAWREAGYGLAAMTYRGGGGTPGEPREEALVADARRVYAALDDLFGRPVPPERRVIWGFSLGSGIAAALAAEVEERALVLEAPFTRLCDAAAHHYPVFPACLLMWDERYDSAEIIDEVGAPLLILHGTEDRVIPHRLGRALFDAAGEPRTFVSVPGGGHEDLWRRGASDAFERFLEATGG